MSWEVPTVRSKASFFSAAIYRKELTRLAPLWAVYLLLMLLILPLSVLTQSDGGTFTMGDLQHLVLSTTLRSSAYINLVYAAALALCLHSWYYSPRSVNAFAALPIRRETWFLTHLAAALTCSLVPNALAALGLLGASAASGLAGGGPALWTFAILSMEFLFFYGLAALCAYALGDVPDLDSAARKFSKISRTFSQTTEYFPKAMKPPANHL